MKGNQLFNLLEGTYEPATAKELILSCVNEQILFNNRELLKCKIYGGDTLEIKKEIDKLESKRKQILDLFKSENMANIHSLIVNSVIEIVV